jgi:hypothetical protein
MTLGVGGGRLQVADEINEIISALLSQLTQKAIGAIGSGLHSLSSPGSGKDNSGRSFADDLNREWATTIIPMPAGGICPQNYGKLSDTECAQNKDVVDLTSDVNDASKQIVNIDNEATKYQLVTSDGRTIDCRDNTLTPQDQAECIAAGKVPPVTCQIDPITQVCTTP